MSFWRYHLFANVSWSDNQGVGMGDTKPSWIPPMLVVVHGEKLLRGEEFLDLFWLSTLVIVLSSSPWNIRSSSEAGGVRQTWLDSLHDVILHDTLRSHKNLATSFPWTASVYCTEYVGWPFLPSSTTFPHLLANKTFNHKELPDTKPTYRLDAHCILWTVYIVHDLFWGATSLITRHSQYTHRYKASI